MALGDRSRRKQKYVPPKLMLTSMMDMFTIILIFLIFSFSENPETLTLGEDLDLPRSSSEADYTQAIRIVLSKSELRVNDEVMAQVMERQIVGLPDEDLTSSSLFQRLKTYRESQKIEEGEPQVRHVLFMCDKTHSFKTINQVIKTAGLAGFPNFQFAVLEEKQE
jgi:biopolymer transport protein ExbD